MACGRFAVVGGIGALRPAARRAARVACRLGVPVARCPDVELAVHEILANALEHGHLGDPDLSIDVEVVRDDPTTVTVRITDRARSGRWTPCRVADTVARSESLGERGRGIRVAMGSADAFDVGSRPGRSTVSLRWSTPGRAINSSGSAAPSTTGGVGVPWSMRRGAVRAGGSERAHGT